MKSEMEKHRWAGSAVGSVGCSAWAAADSQAAAKGFRPGSGSGTTIHGKELIDQDLPGNEHAKVTKDEPAVATSAEA